MTWVNSILSWAALSAPSACISAALRGLQGLAALIDDGVGDRLGLIQGQRTVEFALGEFRLGARIRKLAVRLLGDRFERAGIDHIEQVAGIDEGAVAKFDTGDEAADPGADLNLFHRLEPSGELVPIGDGAFGRLRDRDRRRRGCRLLRRLVAAAGQGDRKQDDQRSDDAEVNGDWNLSTREPNAPISQSARLPSPLHFLRRSILLASSCRRIVMRLSTSLCKNRAGSSKFVGQRRR